MAAAASFVVLASSLQEIIVPWFFAAPQPQVYRTSHPVDQGS